MPPQRPGLSVSCRAGGWGLRAPKHVSGGNKAPPAGQSRRPAHNPSLRDSVEAGLAGSAQHAGGLQFCQAMSLRREFAWALVGRPCRLLPRTRRLVAGCGRRHKAGFSSNTR